MNQIHYAASAVAEGEMSILPSTSTVNPSESSPRSISDNGSDQLPSSSSVSSPIVDLRPINEYEKNEELKRRFQETVKSDAVHKGKKAKISSSQTPYARFFEDIESEIDPSVNKANPSLRCKVSVKSGTGADDICGEILTNFAGQSYNNLKLHLKRKHGIILDNTKSGQRQLTLAEVKDSKTKYPSSNCKQRLFDRGIVRMYALDGCPFNTVEKEGFKSIVQTLDPRVTIKSRQTYVQRLHKMVSEEVVPSIKAKLKEIEKRFCHFSCDIWSTRAMEGVMCILGHFISDQWTLQQTVLHFESVSEQHTGAAIREIFFKCLASYKVSADWGGVVVSDNAANMKNSFNLMNIGMDKDWKSIFEDLKNFHEDEKNLNLNEFNTSGECEENQDIHVETHADIEFMNDVDNIDEEAADFASRVVQEFAEEMFRSTLNLPITGHLFCAAHSLQLGINDALSKDRFVKEFIGVVNKVMVFFKTSTLWRTELKKETKLEPVLPGKTRWNSTLDMLKRFQEQEFFRAARNVIDRALLVRPKNRNGARLPPALGVLHLQQAQELHSILHPMGIATDALQSDGPTSNEVLLRVVLAYRDLLALSTNVFEEFRLSLLSNLKSRMQPYIERKEYIIATILDPRLKASLFQLNWSISMKLDVPNVEVAIQHLKDAYEAEIVLSKIGSPTKKNSGPSTESGGVFSIVREALESNRNPDKTEIDYYLEESASEKSASPLGYWKGNSERYPVLARLARKYLAIPATSAGVERIFSIAGSLARFRRSKIGTQKIAELLMLRYHE